MKSRTLAVLFLLSACVCTLTSCDKDGTTAVRTHQSGQDKSLVPRNRPQYLKGAFQSDATIVLYFSDGVAGSSYEILNETTGESISGVFPTGQSNYKITIPYASGSYLIIITFPNGTSYTNRIYI